MESRTLVSVSGSALSLMKLAVLHPQLQQIHHHVVYIDTQGDDPLIEIANRWLGEALTVISLNEPSTHHTTAKVLIEIEKLIKSLSASFLLAADDTEACLGASLVASQELCPVIALDAGQRYYDRRRSSEIRRITIDNLAELLFSNQKAHSKALKKEGIDEQIILEVGDTISPTLSLVDALAKSKPIETSLAHYVWIDLKHPSNALDPHFYPALWQVMADLPADRMIVLPLPKHLMKTLQKSKLWESSPANVHPIPYPKGADWFQWLQKAHLVITDHAEAEVGSSLCNIQCIYFGRKSSVPNTVSHGTNHEVGQQMHELRNLSLAILEGYHKRIKKDARWDGNGLTKIAETLNAL